MARGSKKKYTSKQKRKEHDIEKGYKKRVVSSKEASRRAWATVNKSDRGRRKKGGEDRGKNGANRARRRAAGCKAVEVPIGHHPTRKGNDRDRYFHRARFFRVAFAPSLPRAVRVFLGRCAIVRFRRADLAAFLMFRFAAARCFLVVISPSRQVSRSKAYA